MEDQRPIQETCESESRSQTQQENERVCNPCEKTVSALRSCLRFCLRRFCEPSSLQVGDFVRFKPYMHTRRRPEKGTVAIVTEVLSVPITEKVEDTGSPYFCDRFDIKVGILADSGPMGEAFLEYLMDSRRMEKVSVDLPSETDAP